MVGAIGAVVVEAWSPIPAISGSMISVMTTRAVFTEMTMVDMKVDPVKTVVTALSLEEPVKVEFWTASRTVVKPP